MHIKIDNDMRRKIIIYASSLVLAIIIGLILFKFQFFWNAIVYFFTACTPFIVGFALAFVLRKPVYWCETHLFHKKRKRLWSTLLVFTIFLCLIVLLGVLIVPAIFESIQSFISSYHEYSKNISNVLEYLEKRNGLHIDIPNEYLNGKWLADYVTNNTAVLANYSLTFLRTLFNALIAFVSAIYIILDKEQLKRSVRKLNYSLFDIRIADMLAVFFTNARNIFDKFIVGSLIDSSIIALICFIGCSLMRLPYVPMISFMIGITNLIPVFGPFLGAIPVVILLLLINPWYAVAFAIFILATQQLDGNIIKPLVLGDQLGLSGFWILFSVTVGGNLGGVLGMFLAVPIFSLFYNTLEDFSNMRLQNKKIKIKDDE